MDENRSRGSPRLQFSKEELENDALSRPIQKAEKAADKYEAAQKKLKRYRVRLTLENRESETASSTDAQQSMHEEDLSAFQAEREPGIQSDPNAPAVQNTRQKPKPEKATLGKASLSDSKAGIEQSGSAAGPESIHPDTAVSGTKKKALRLKFEETQKKKPSQLTHPFGKQVMKSVYGRTQRDVKEKLERLKADLEGKSAEQAVQSDSDSGKDKKEVIGKEAENTGDGICMLTLEQWLDIWRKQYLSNVKPGTVCHYESVCRLHIVPALGNIPLVKLRTPAIQKFYIDLQEKGLSPKYIKNIHGCLHKALDIAVRIDYITKNPTSACIIPRVIQKEMHPLDAPEQVQLLQSLKGKKNEALIVTALFTGMRAGELLGLTWDNVDFDHGVIHIVKQLTQSRGEGHPFAFGTLKNGKTRSINPAPFVLETLKAHKEYQEEQKRIAGDLWNEGKFPNLVFTHADGSHLSQPTIWKAFQKALEDAGLDHHRLHDCRHTFAVNSIRAGDDIKTIQENMGHYSAAFTLDRYGHVTETMRQESANRMQAFIQGMSGNGGGNS